MIQGHNWKSGPALGMKPRQLGPRVIGREVAPTVRDAIAVEKLTSPKRRRVVRWPKMCSPREPRKHEGAAGG